VAQLCQHRDKLKQLNAKVILISFSALEYAKGWLEEVCPSFTLLLDPERATYRTYGVERSWFRSWNLKTLWRYVQLLSAGRKWRGIQGDSAQLGGDFIIDTDGIVRMAHRSHDPTDRPSVTNLLAIFHRLDKKAVG
jgi:peroxiredoxin